MNKKQWWTFAILFIIASAFFWNMSFTQQKIQTETLGNYIYYLKIWLQKQNETGTIDTHAPELGEGYVIATLSSRLYMSLGVISFLIFLACLISSFFEKEKNKL